MQIGVEANPLAQVQEQAGEQDKGHKGEATGTEAQVQVPVEVQLDGVARCLGGGHKHRQEHQHKENGAHQHHGADEAEVVQGVGLQEQQAQEGAYGGDIAHQQRIHLLGQGLPFIGLVLEMIYVMQRIIDGYADDGAADPQHNEADAALEQGDDAQRNEGAGGNGNEDPEHIGQAFVAEPQDNADKYGGNGQRQDGILFDALGVAYGYLRAAGGKDADLRIGLAYFLFHFIDLGQPLGVAGGFAAAVGRSEEENAGFPAWGKEPAVHHLCLGHGLLKALENGAVQVQRIGAHVLLLNGIGAI